MNTRLKGVVGVVLGGLMLSGIAYAAVQPSLTPIVSLREPSVVVKTALGTATAVSTTSLTVHVPATKKIAAADYTFRVAEDTKIYYRNSVQGAITDIKVGDTVKVWTLKLVDGTAIKIWDRKLWLGSKTGRVESLEIISSPTVSTATFTLRYNRSIAYNAETTANTVIVTEVAATGNTSATTTPATLNDLHVAAGATLGTKITATGLWNDTQKLWTLTRIVIRANQN